jgi:ketosteroid isomerase-like protein
MGGSPRAWMGAAAALAALALAGCGLLPSSAESAVADPEAGAGRSRLEREADRLLETDRAFAARSLEAGAPQAFAQFFDEEGMQLGATGEPVIGAERVREVMAAGPEIVLSWEPRYAEVFAPGAWGWTWGDWMAHEPGAGGRRVAQGRYVNVWKKQADGSWKVRMDIGSAEREVR